jgi:hypothetical protein
MNAQLSQNKIASLAKWGILTWKRASHIREEKM